MNPSVTKAFVWALPKAELHLHLEGTLEPSMMLEFAKRNRVSIQYPNVDAIERAHTYVDLQSFLDLYYAGCSVLVTEDDFYDLTMAYIRKAASQGVCHVEVFFDPQSHTARGISFHTVINGIHQALIDGEAHHGVTSRLILSFLRHLDEEDAFATLRAAEPYLSWITAVGLDSSEVANPPSKFVRVYDQARAHGLQAVVHAGEEGPPEYVWQALDLLHTDRIDHGVRCLEDDRLVKRLRDESIPLTVCPLSNVKLQVFPTLGHHNLPQLLDQGICVTINSDDPAYFGGYLGDNLWAVTRTFEFSHQRVADLARNSILASFLTQAEMSFHLQEIERVVAEFMNQGP